VEEMMINEGFKWKNPFLLASFYQMSFNLCENASWFYHPLWIYLYY
jgi:hypothetical protein